MINSRITFVAFIVMTTVMAVMADSAFAQYCSNPRGTSAPTGGNACQPCNHANLVLSNSLLNALDEDLKGFVQLLAGDVADIDGNFLIDDSGDSLVASLTGDDIRDIANQMNVVRTIMLNPAQFPAGSPIPSDDLFAAYQANLNVLRNEKFGPSTLGIIDLLIKDILPLLVYFTLLGTEDDFANIVSEDPIVTNGRGTLGVLRALLVLLNGVEVGTSTLEFISTEVNPGDFITFGDLLGPDGDLDEDGFSNICEYRHFRRNLCDTRFPNIAPAVDAGTAYVTAVLDPNITPTGCFETETVDDDCRLELTPGSVVPPTTSTAYGEVRFRRFRNAELNQERFQVNFLHTIESTAPSAKFVKGLPGQAGTQVLLNVPVATPQFWEVYVDATTANTLKTNPNYFEVTGNTSDTPPQTQTIRADNSCGVLAPPPPVPHSADTNRNFIIEVNEILTVISFANAGGYQCGEGGTFLPGAGDESCEPHDSDYSPQNFRISLPELLRLVQLFSAGEYEECIGGSEDGYCITVD